MKASDLLLTLAKRYDADDEIAALCWGKDDLSHHVNALGLTYQWTTDDANEVLREIEYCLSAQEIPDADDLEQHVVNRAVEQGYTIKRQN